MMILQKIRSSIFWIVIIYISRQKFPVQVGLLQASFLFPPLVCHAGGLMSFESSSRMIFRQVCFTPPGGLRQLSACSNSKAAVKISLWSMRSTYPSHFNLRACIVLARGVSLAVFNSSTVGVVVHLCKMCRKHLFSNNWMDFRSDCLVGQLSQP